MGSDREPSDSLVRKQDMATGTSSGVRRKARISYGEVQIWSKADRDIVKKSMDQVVFRGRCNRFGTEGTSSGGSRIIISG